MAQEIYHRSNWGNPTETWGNTYLNADLTNELYKRASEYENSWVTDQLLNGVGIKPSIILTPTAYEDGVLNSVKPSNGNGDFDFTRGSSATRVNEQGLVEDVQILSGELVQNGDFEQIGSELVTNGGFDTDSDWVKQNGWSIENSLAIFSGTVSAYRKLYQENILTIGKIYKLTFDIVSINSGSIKNFSQSSPTSYSTIGTKTEYFTATYDDLFLEPTTDADLTIDNVSVKEVGQNWTFGIGWSMGDGKAISDGSANNDLRYETTFNPSILKIKFDVNDLTQGSVRLFVNTPTFTQLINATSNGSYETTVEVTSGANNLYFYSTNNFIGSIDNVSVIEITDDTDLPRINYTNFDYENGEVVPYSGEGSLLLENQSTNLITYSEDLSEWIASDITVTDNNSTSPDGSQNASKLELNSGTSIKRILLGSMPTSAVTRAYSVFVKADSDFTGAIQLVHSGDLQGFANFDLSDGTVGSTGSKTTANIVNYSNGWYRCTAIFDSSNAFGSSIYLWMQDDDSSSYGGSTSATGSVFAYGFQYEQGSYATSYIPTNGSTVTRLADVCNNSGNSDLINSTEGVLYAEISALANDGSSRTIALNKDSNDRIQMYFDTTDNVLSIFYKAQGTHIFGMSETLDDATEFNKIAFKWKTNDFALWVNGTETDTVSSGVTSNANTLNALEFEMFNDFAPFYGNVKCVAVFKEALSDTELQKLTTI